MESKKLNVVQLPDGQMAIVFTENPSKQLGIVDVATVRRLAKLLPSANLRVIKEQFIEQLRNVNSMQEYVDVIAEEFNFHTTVNLLNTFDPTSGSDIR